MLFYTLFYQSNHFWNWNLKNGHKCCWHFRLSIEPFLELKLARNIAEEAKTHVLSIEPFLELKLFLPHQVKNNTFIYQSNHFWNWNRKLFRFVFREWKPINRTIFGIETWKHHQVFEYLRVSINRTIFGIETTTGGMVSRCPSGLSIEPFLELKRVTIWPSTSATRAINRTIRGIETGKNLNYSQYQKPYQSNHSWNWNIKNPPTQKPQ